MQLFRDEFATPTSRPEPESNSQTSGHESNIYILTTFVRRFADVWKCSIFEGRFEDVLWTSVYIGSKLNAVNAKSGIVNVHKQKNGL